MSVSNSISTPTFICLYVSVFISICVSVLHHVPEPRGRDAPRAVPAQNFNPFRHLRSELVDVLLGHVPFFVFNFLFGDALVGLDEDALHEVEAGAEAVQDADGLFFISPVSPA